MIYQGLFDLDQFLDMSYNFIHLEISKLHFAYMLFSTIHVRILEQLLVPKILFFLFIFAACHRHPLSFSRGWTSHIIKCLRMQYKVLRKTLHTFKWNSLFFFYSFLSSAHFFICFFSNVLMHTCVHSDWLHIEAKLIHWKR